MIARLGFLARALSISILILSAIASSRATGNDESFATEDKIQNVGGSVIVEWRSHTKSIVGISLPFCHLTDHDIQAIGDLRSLRELDLSGNFLSDQGFNDLLKIESLHALRLFPNQGKITSDGIVRISLLHELEELGLSCTNLSGDAAKSLGDLGNLRSLTLAGNFTVTEQHTRQLCRLRKLTKLGIIGAEITPTAVEELKGMSRLTELDLSSTNVSGTAIQRMSQISTLRALRLMCNTDLGDPEIRLLSQLHQLEELHVSGYKFTDQCLDDIRHLKDLRKLTLESRAISCSEAGRLSEMENLEVVRLQTGTPSRNAIDELSKLSQLRLLIISGRGVTEEFLDALRKRLRTTEVRDHD